ncbi:hypothetical protein M422DRAFT_38853 [Sphaerobolus stellatus SS14]|uniref:F-box domain-containing protein n=1 Tax=Sphaerobolus stellatus (strain SS14) TaxID=990650 RepID=A0A0C9UIQ1_SPHS4|nr:hypothetical protein M422DRAFT_38853 [Sphaerobolus stellatus SS14]
MMDTYNWDFLDLLDAPKLQALTIAQETAISPSSLRRITCRNSTCLTHLKLSCFTIDHIVVDQITKAFPKLEELVFLLCRVESFLVDREDSRLLEMGIRWIIFEDGEISESIMRTLLVRLADREKLQANIVEPRLTVQRVISGRARQGQRSQIENLKKKFSAIFEVFDR